MDLHDIDSILDRQGSTTLKFTTAQALMRSVRQSSNDVLYVEGVSAEDFANIEKLRGENLPFRLKNFSQAERLLIITVPTLCNERMHSTLYDYIKYEIAAMGLRYSWSNLNAATMRAENGGSVVEGDSAGVPTGPNGDAQRWPTLVIEGGYSQSINALVRQAKSWFIASQHQVKIVLLMKLNRSPPGEIIIEQWKELRSQGRPGATTTRGFDSLVPSRIQRITIQKTLPSADPWNSMSYRVSRGPLELEFADIFLRAPGPGEGNIVVGDQDLRELGAAVARLPP
ncbi:unnamed protein product [Clonostachys rosea]|uniref:Uncharacterized protein n=1 Tax=Bionectria ochroleuca TaxID=29856 RepID=A0ABY6TZY3_BIOOC|nr:unnamed protein product [Clonostachys rosea]